MKLSTAAAFLALSLAPFTSGQASAEDVDRSAGSDFDHTPLTFDQDLAQAVDASSESTIAQASGTSKTSGAAAAEASGPSQEALAKAAQNPIASMISIPIQWNATPNTQWAPNAIDPDADHDKVLNVVNVQPVFPFKLSDDWTVVTRTIVPFLGVPWADPKIGVTEAGDPYLKRWDQEQRVGI